MGVRRGGGGGVLSLLTAVLRITASLEVCGCQENGRGWRCVAARRSKLLAVNSVRSCLITRSVPLPTFFVSFTDV